MLTNEQFVDDAMERIPDGDTDVMTDFYRNWIVRILDAVDATNEKLGFDEQIDDIRRITTYEALYCASLNKTGRPRGSGEPYMAHPFAVTERQISGHHITTPWTLIGTLNHDNVEKKLVTRERESMLYPAYADQLTQLSRDHVFREIRKRQWEVVSTLSKLHNAPDDITRETEYFISLAKGVRREPHVGTIKVADCWHNSLTLPGMEKIPEKGLRRAREKAHEYSRVHRHFAQLLRLYDSEADITDGVTAYVNPELLADYKSLQKEREQTYVDPIRKEIEEQFFTKEGKTREERFHDAIESFSFEPLRLSMAVKRRRLGTEPLDEVEFSDLRIDKDDPLHDIVIVVQKPEDVERICRRIEKNFEVFGHGFETEVLGNRRGRLIVARNSKFNCALTFRVNDARSEAHSKRGVLDYRNTATTQREIARERKKNQEERTPSYIGANIEAMLRQLEYCGQNSRVSDIYPQIMFPDTISFFYDDKRYGIDEGATGFDVAARVDPKFLLDFRKAEIKRTPDSPPRTVTLAEMWDPIPRNVHIIDVETSGTDSKQHDSRKAGKIAPHPCWQAAMQPMTKKVLRELLKNLSGRRKRKMGQEYLQRFCELFSLDEDELFENYFAPQTYGKNSKNKNKRASHKDHFIRDIGAAKIDLMEYHYPLFREEKDWDLNFENLTNRPGSLLQILEPLGNIGISFTATDLSDMEGNPATGDLDLKIKLNIKIRLPEGYHTTYDFMRTMFRLSEKIRLQPENRDSKVFCKPINVAI